MRSSPGSAHAHPRRGGGGPFGATRLKFDLRRQTPSKSRRARRSPEGTEVRRRIRAGRCLLSSNRCSPPPSFPLPSLFRRRGACVRVCSRSRGAPAPRRSPLPWARPLSARPPRSPRSSAPPSALPSPPPALSLPLPPPPPPPLPSSSPPLPPLLSPSPPPPPPPPPSSHSPLSLVLRPFGVAGLLEQHLPQAEVPAGRRRRS